VIPERGREGVRTSLERGPEVFAKTIKRTKGRREKNRGVVKIYRSREERRDSRREKGESSAVRKRRGSHRRGKKTGAHGIRGFSPSMRHHEGKRRTLTPFLSYSMKRGGGKSPYCLLPRRERHMSREGGKPCRVCSAMRKKTKPERKKLSLHHSWQKGSRNPGSSIQPHLPRHERAGHRNRRRKRREKEITQLPVSPKKKWAGSEEGGGEKEGNSCSSGREGKKEDNTVCIGPERRGITRIWDGHP